MVTRFMEKGKTRKGTEGKMVASGQERFHREGHI